MTSRHSIVAACLVLAAGASIAPAQEYRAVIIEPWNQGYNLATSAAAGINNSNVVSGCATPLSGLCSFLWTLEGGKVQVNLAGAINDDGYVAGGRTLRAPDGTLVDMPGLGGARDINNDRVVAGAVTGRYWGGCRYTRHATVWDEARGGRSLVDLGVPAAHESRAVNNRGEIVGVRSSTGSCGDFEAFYYNVHTGEHVDIHQLLLGGGMGITEAFDINDNGVVVGDGPIGGEVRVFTWSRDDGFATIPNLPGTLPSYSHASSINAAGTVVGEAIVDEAWRAWIWDERSGIRDLNVLTADLPDNFFLVEAIKINDNGWIIARGQFEPWSPERAVVLVPVDRCRADMDGNGRLDIRDFFAFQAAFAAGDGRADFDDNGRLDIRDFFAFQAAFAAGC